ncbi:MAG: CxxxxCH/CxxCH domain-containing protein [Labilithrix sp.]|nr:CxxxxCH/CxxCH domain-containing protein [Labilithrix sp.]
MRLRSLLLTTVLLGAAFAACETPRTAAPSPSYTTRIQGLLEARCVRCHADFAPGGGWTADSYLGAIGCTDSGEPVTLARADGLPPLLAALDRSDHAGVVDEAERAMLAAWLAAGAPRSGGGVHPATFADPRSPKSHGQLLRARGYVPMLDASDPDACGSCHDGLAARRAEIRTPAAGAPACTSCHAEIDGPLGCGTCHGEGARAYPPRSRCFFPADPMDRAHAAHAGPSASRAAGLPCSTCHPTPASGAPAGVHANGWVDVWFDFAIAGREARFDLAQKSCTGTCHARGGARPSPAWSDAPMTCNDCHASPPADHPRGACTSCHHEANADGTALTTPSLHLNGKVDLGDGSGRCGSCHGQGDDPWPSTGAHRAHAAPKSARPVPCETCHAVPERGASHPEGKGGAGVRLAGLAVRGGRRASFDPTTKTCAGTYCHEGAGAARPSPRWIETSATTCTSCHGAPPPAPHPQSTTCGGAACHEGRTDGLALTPAGRLAHVDGFIDRVAP